MYACRSQCVVVDVVLHYSGISAVCQLSSHCVLLCPILPFSCFLLLLPADYAQHQQWWPGNLSFRDFIADLAGTAVATAAILALHRPQASSATLAGLATSLRPAAAPAAGPAAAAAPPKRGAYKALPTADIEMGLASSTSD